MRCGERLTKITPRSETVIALTCQCALSELCKGMCHHYGVKHVSPRLHIYRSFDHVGTSAAAGSVLPHQRPRQPDSALRALLLAYRLELRHARLRASRGRTCRERLAPTCRTVGARYGWTEAGHPAVSAWRPEGVPASAPWLCGSGTRRLSSKVGGTIISRLRRPIRLKPSR